METLTQVRETLIAATTMKALAKTKAREGIWQIDAPVPQPGAEDVVIKVRRTAICGTDIHI